MPDTSPLAFQPAAPIESLLATIALSQTASEGMRAMMDRQSEFPSPLQAQLTGVALDPYGRQVADQALDTYWSDEPRKQDLLRSSLSFPLILILAVFLLVGLGFGAAGCIT
jgi:hypothetical protein